MVLNILDGDRGRTRCFDALIVRPLTKHPREDGVEVLAISGTNITMSNRDCAKTLLEARIEDTLLKLMLTTSTSCRLGTPLRLTNIESTDHLDVAARNIARRRSSLKAIPIGQVIHQARPRRL